MCCPSQYVKFYAVLLGCRVCVGPKHGHALGGKMARDSYTYRPKLKFSLLSLNWNYLDCGMTDMNGRRLGPVWSSIPSPLSCATLILVPPRGVYTPGARHLCPPRPKQSTICYGLFDQSHAMFVHHVFLFCTITCPLERYSVCHITPSIQYAGDLINLIFFYLLTAFLLLLLSISKTPHKDKDMVVSASNPR
jgi:hypothetical protein